MDSTPARRDVHVTVPCRPHLLLLEPRLAEHGVRVRVNKSGSENSAATVDDFSAGKSGRDVARSANRGDAAGADGDRSVRQDSSVAHLASLSGASWAGAGD